ncbi:MULTISPECIES: hypothetical protein [Pseudochrobactrum]|uniref:hypothetical protein n=1 Tax=Pseudochrobactrum TaxID=354349 RepID=UPI0003A97712|nr:MULTISPECIES: hypothetical protein [unclassified Pseudochrobactrum]
MFIRDLLKVVMTSAIVLIPAAEAYAYKNISQKDSSGRTVHWVRCDNGYQFIVGDGSSAPSAAFAERICAKQGSGLTTGAKDKVKEFKGLEAVSK